MEKTYNIAILGATGTVGDVMLEILDQRGFPVEKLYPLASSRSAGERVAFGKKSLTVRDAESFDFSKVDIALFSAGAAASEKYAPIAAEAGCIVIDNTSQFRYEQDVPLVIPEVNPSSIKDYENRMIIANPNCSTIQMLVALKPIYDAVGINRINVATYQSVSGAGRKGVGELAMQTAKMLNGEHADVEVFTKKIAFNAIPHIDTFQSNGYTREEMKMVWETKKIFADPDIQVNPTAVRIPTFYGHSEAIHIETESKMTAQQATELLRTSPGILLHEEEEYPTIMDAAGEDAVYVGRIREDISHPKGLNLWVVADNVRKGAALNAIQIAELLIKDYL